MVVTECLIEMMELSWGNGRMGEMLSWRKGTQDKGHENKGVQRLKVTHHTTTEGTKIFPKGRFGVMFQSMLLDRKRWNWKPEIMPERDCAYVTASFT